MSVCNQLQDEERRRKQQLEEIRKREAEERAKLQQQQQEEERRWREEERAKREAEEKVCLFKESSNDGFDLFLHVLYLTLNQSSVTLRASRRLLGLDQSEFEFLPALLFVRLISLFMKYGQVPESISAVERVQIHD